MTRRPDVRTGTRPRSRPAQPAAIVGLDETEPHIWMVLVADEPNDPLVVGISHGGREPTNLSAGRTAVMATPSNFTSKRGRPADRSMIRRFRFGVLEDGQTPVLYSEDVPANFPPEVPGEPVA